MPRQSINLKLIEFFKSYDKATQSKMYSLLLIELDSLLQSANLLGDEQQKELNNLNHKFNGVCRYLKLEKDIIVCKDMSRIELLSKLSTLQCSLKEIHIEAL